MAEPTSDAMINRKIADFKVLEKLGEGGMGAVYRATQISLDREVALKILPQRLVDKNPGYVQRFLREAKVAAKINHPNIVQVIATGNEGDVYYMAMEYVEGLPLDAMLEKSGNFSEHQALNILKQAVRGLAAGERYNLIHRDIKPANLMVSQDGFVKVADFGLAKNEESESMLTHSGQVMGTPAYMSPEQAQGEAVDARTDIYALGVTLYHMITGRVPFRGENVIAVLMKHTSEPVPDPREHNPSVSDGVRTLAMRMMAKSPNDRFPSFSKLGEAIQGIAPTSIRNAPAGLPGGDPLGPIKTPDTILPAVGAPSSGIPTPATLDRLAVSDADQTATQKRTALAGEGEGRPPNRRILLWAGLAVAAVLLLAAGGIVTALVIQGKGEKTGASSGKTGDEPAAGPAEAGTSDAAPSGASFALKWLSPQGISWHRTEEVTLAWQVTGAPPEDASATVAGETLSRSLLEPGRWEHRLSLAQGEHAIEFSIQTPSAPLFQKTLVIRVDSTAPRIRVSKPGASPSATNQAKISLTGEVLEDNLLRFEVNGKIVAVQGGRFLASLDLTEGENTIALAARDRAGNVTETKVRIRRDSRTPRLLTQNPFPRQITRGESKLKVLLRFDEDVSHVVLKGISNRKVPCFACPGGCKVSNPFFQGQCTLCAKRLIPSQRLHCFMLHLAPGGNKIDLHALDEAGNRFRLSRDILFLKLLPGLVAGKKAGEVRNKVDGKIMQAIPAGTYPVGSHAPGGKRTVTLPGFYISSMEVSNRQFAVFLNAVKREKDPSGIPYYRVESWVKPDLLRLKGRWSARKGAEHLPVVNVTWTGARAYARWAGGVLPREAEWEVAASYDPKTRRQLIYPWGDGKPAGKILNAGKLLGRLSPGGRYPKDRSPFGVWDMGGNAMEWCEDRWQHDWRQALAHPPPSRLKNPGPGGDRAVRGGSFWHPRAHAKASHRTGLRADAALPTVGFRYVMTDKP